MVRAGRSFEIVGPGNRKIYLLALDKDGKDVFAQ